MWNQPRNLQRLLHVFPVLHSQHISAVHDAQLHRGQEIIVAAPCECQSRSLITSELFQNDDSCCRSNLDLIILSWLFAIMIVIYCDHDWLLVYGRAQQSHHVQFQPPPRRLSPSAPVICRRPRGEPGVTFQLHEDQYIIHFSYTFQTDFIHISYTSHTLFIHIYSYFIHVLFIHDSGWSNDEMIKWWNELWRLAHWPEHWEKTNEN